MEKTSIALWSESCNSTFRIIQLLRNGAVIQPTCVIDLSRKSTMGQMEVMDNLNTKIPKRFNNSECKLRTLISFGRKNIPFNPLLKLTYKKLKKRIILGKQFY